MRTWREPRSKKRRIQKKWRKRLGIYGNHAISMKLLNVAMGECVILKFPGWEGYEDQFKENRVD